MRGRPASPTLREALPVTTASRPMTTAARELSASSAFVERNFNLTRRYWGWELAFLVYAVAGALSISLIGAAAADKRLHLQPRDRRDLLELPVRRSSASSPRRSAGSAGRARSSTR